MTFIEELRDVSKKLCVCGTHYVNTGYVEKAEELAGKLDAILEKLNETIAFYTLTEGEEPLTEGEQGELRHAKKLREEVLSHG